MRRGKAEGFGGRRAGGRGGRRATDSLGGRSDGLEAVLAVAAARGLVRVAGILLSRSMLGVPPAATLASPRPCACRRSIGGRGDTERRRAPANLEHHCQALARAWRGRPWRGRPVGRGRLARAASAMHATCWASCSRAVVQSAAHRKQLNQHGSSKFLPSLRLPLEVLASALLPLPPFSFLGPPPHRAQVDAPAAPALLRFESESKARLRSAWPQHAPHLHFSAQHADTLNSTGTRADTWANTRTGRQAETGRRAPGQRRGQLDVHARRHTAACPTRARQPHVLPARPPAAPVHPSSNQPHHSACIDSTESCTCGPRGKRRTRARGAAPWDACGCWRPSGTRRRATSYC